MTNNQLLKKMSQDMNMRNFSHYTYDSYLAKTNAQIGSLKNYNCRKLILNYAEMLPKDVKKN